MSNLEIKITIDTDQVPSHNEDALIQSFMRFRAALAKLSGEHKIDFFRTIGANYDTQNAGV